MKSKSPLLTFLFVMGMIIALFIIIGQMSDEGKIPPLSNFLNENVASSTDDITFGLLTTDVIAPSSTISVLVAADDASRRQGLSGIPTMAENDGMLFAFDEPQISGFWMKDMNFSLDMVWIDGNKEVVSISEDIATSTYPKTFSPKSPILYVLEINAGSAKKFGITTGTKLQFDLPK